MKGDKPKCEYHRLREGLAIRKVPQSKNYGIYLKLPEQKALQFSLKTSDYDEAVEKAWEEFTYAKALVRNGEMLRQPKQRLTLHQIIDELINEHELVQNKTKEEKRDGKHATHIRLFKKIKEYYNVSLKPSGLDNPKVRDYFQANQPFSNTQLVATRYCFTQIFDRSFEKKLIKKDQIVELNKIKVEKQKQNRRDHFTYIEFAKVAMHGLKQIKYAHGKGKHTQKMAVFYSSFLFYSGVRAGFEALGIKWSDLGYTSYGDLYCVIKDGKTKNYTKKNRNVIFDMLAEDCIDQVANVKYPHITNGKTKREVIDYLIINKPNDTIFSTKHSLTPIYPKIFKKWISDLKEQGVLSSSKDLTLYSLRHSYITRSIEEEVPLPLIAENAGTSVSMIEKHYSHITVMTNEARKALLRDKIMLETEVPIEEQKKRRNDISHLIEHVSDKLD
ncbi:tyrosine-type recombinase/integrase [Vibrio paucivorans]|uniref:Tyrosine-type recombinase/integrase n=1 Tax=Vibrio paucivorans TaxID=2829489 RepID=A0A9X3CGW5_9VIBR|nr:tyrosine-type recombinase/integrase [Vibrio paucivorans]MCW8335629.1 tyrosine-type recombinase/integrase [Vibrio paucivorans]